MAALASSSKRLALLHFGLGRGTTVNLGDASGQLGQAFLQLLAIVVTIGGFDLAANLLGATVDFVLLAAAADDGRVAAVILTFLTVPRSDSLTLSRFDAQVLEDRRLAPVSTAMSPQHRLATIAVTGSLDAHTH